jgi:Putative transposase/Transposase zinc-binding domain
MTATAAARAGGLQQVLRSVPNWQATCGPGALPVLGAIAKCRTPALGHHLYACTDKEGCGHTTMRYHSCRNRHCPHCGNPKKDEWIEARMRELLPCKYHHVVFTLPHELSPIVMGNRKAMFNLLFEASSAVLGIFAKDKKHMGALPGIISVLHTWGQQLSFHPHVHCIVTGHGWDEKNKQWTEGKKVRHKRLFPVKAMEVVYAAYFMRRLGEMEESGEIALNGNQKNAWPEMVRTVKAKRWVVYAKEPFGGPAQVVEYLGRYTHKVAISNNRIKEVSEDGEVTFAYKDYADEGKTKEMALPGMEFIRRFAQHILPRRFCKIRSYGLYANHKRHTRVNMIMEALGKPLHPPHTQVPWHIRFIERNGTDPLLCPACKKAQMALLRTVHGNKGEVVQV